MDGKNYCVITWCCVEERTIFKQVHGEREKYSKKKNKTMQRKSQIREKAWFNMQRKATQAS